MRGCASSGIATALMVPPSPHRIRGDDAAVGLSRFRDPFVRSALWCSRGVVLIGFHQFGTSRASRDDTEEDQRGSSGSTFVGQTITSAPERPQRVDLLLRLLVGGREDALVPLHDRSGGQTHPCIARSTSIIVPPGFSRPARSASSIIVTAMRSLIELPGLKVSTFAVRRRR